MTDRRCGTCSLWDIERAKDKAGRVLRRRVARCLWAVTRWPASVSEWRRTIFVSHMTAYDGSECSCWQPRKETTDAD